MQCMACQSNVQHLAPWVALEQGSTSAPHASTPALPFRLDPMQVRPSERIAAAQQVAGLEEQLRAELLAEGLDPDEASQVGVPLGGLGCTGMQVVLAIQGSFEI